MTPEETAAFSRQCDEALERVLDILEGYEGRVAASVAAAVMADVMAQAGVPRKRAVLMFEAAARQRAAFDAAKRRQH